MTIIFIYYCPCTSLQVFIQDITYTKILTVICARAFVCVCVCVSFYAFPYNPGCKWSLWEQRMRPLPSISLIKSKLLSLSLSIYLSLFHSFFPPSKSEKNDVSLSVHSKPLCSLSVLVLYERHGGWWLVTGTFWTVYRFVIWYKRLLFSPFLLERESGDQSSCGWISEHFLIYVCRNNKMQWSIFVRPELKHRSACPMFGQKT